MDTTQLRQLQGVAVGRRPPVDEGQSAEQGIGFGEVSRRLRQIPFSSAGKRPASTVNTWWRKLRDKPVSRCFQLVHPVKAVVAA